MIDTVVYYLHVEIIKLETTVLLPIQVLSADRSGDLRQQWKHWKSATLNNLRGPKNCF